jgi:uncharacterized delta-60 repeat protein
MKKILSLIFVFLFNFLTYSQPGMLDLTFAGSGIATYSINGGDDQASSIAIQSDGNIVATGWTNDGAKFDFAIIRLKPNGLLDNTFGIGGMVTTSIGSDNAEANDISIQNDGKLVVSGTSYNGSDKDFAIVRYNSDGTLDNSFGTGGIVRSQIGNYDDIAYSNTIQSDGKIIIGGTAKNASFFNFAIARYNTNGSIDSSFGNSGKVVFGTSINNVIRDIAIQNDGKIIAAGEIYGVNSRDFAVIRLTTNGLFDSSFNNNGIIIYDLGYSYDDFANSLYIQNDGKIVCAGTSSSLYNSFASIVRYDSAGILDTTFLNDVNNIGGYNKSGIKSINCQNNNKLVAVGYLSGLSSFGIMRYNSDGTLDNTFGINGFVIDTNLNCATDIAIQNDGKLVCSIAEGAFPAGFQVARYLGDPTGIANDLNSTLNVSIFPNPVTDKINLHFQNAKAFHKLNVSLFSIEGQLLIQKSLECNNFSIDVSGLATGIYFLKLSNEIGTTIEKIFKK